MLTPSKLTLIAGCLFTACGQASMTIDPDPNNPNGYLVSRVELNAAEQAKTANPMYAIWARALQTQPNSVVEAIEPGLASNPGNVQRVERVFPQSEWDYLTHMAAPEYTYTRFLRAIGKFPAFCGDYTDGRDADAICKKSIVTAFAHFSQETGGHIAKDNVSDNPLALEEWQQALVHVREMGWSEGQEGYTTGCGQNDWQNARWPCAAGQGYFGRGAKQLSYHFNYGAFSEAMFDGDATVLLNNPGLVADSWLNLASAIWFFLTPQAPKPAMLHVIDRTWVPSQREIDAGIGYGFGTTINVINGGLNVVSRIKTKASPSIVFATGKGSPNIIKYHSNLMRKTPAGNKRRMAASTLTARLTCCIPTGMETGSTIRIALAVIRLSVNWWAFRPLIPRWLKAITRNVLLTSMVHTQTGLRYVWLRNLNLLTREPIRAAMCGIKMRFITLVIKWCGMGQLMKQNGGLKETIPPMEGLGY